jgi:hypothetical protein
MKEKILKLASQYYKGLKPESNLDDVDLVYLDIRKEPFDIYGLYDPKNQPVFKRCPDEVGLNTNASVTDLYLNTAGGRIRFCTDSTYLALKAVVPNINHMTHMTLTGSSGFSLYLDGEDSSTFINRFTPEYSNTDWYEGRLRFGDNKLRYFTLYFPLYNKVDNVYIGVQSGSRLEHGKEYRYKKPVVYYGSSITQGGCASRPGNDYEGIICKMYNTDYINLGFSGAARGEDIMANYIAGLDMSIFVMDYDHNAPSPDRLLETHEKFFKIIRERQKALPVIFLSKPDFKEDEIDDIHRRNTVYTTYLHAKDAGDENVYYIDGRSLFQNENRDCCTVDGCHPNDAGFLRMADAIGYQVKKILSK